MMTADRDNDKIGNGATTMLPLRDGRVYCAAKLCFSRAMKTENACLDLAISESAMAGGRLSDDKGRVVVLPKERGEALQVYAAVVRSFTLTSAKGEKVTFSFAEPTRVSVQDSRRWVPEFTVRIDSFCGRVTEGTVRTWSCILSAKDGMAANVAKAYTIEPNQDWISLGYKKDIVAGSALDLSNQGLLDAPAGKYGWMRNVNGHFEFEKRPGKPQRLYGVNLCFSACFPDDATAERLVTRLVRLGYNTIRIHHYESEDGIVKGSKDGVSLNADRMRQLDNLIALAISNGIYVTTDLYTSRVVPWRALGVDRDGRCPQQVYKNYIAFSDAAFENYKTFTRNFLCHVNPYTGRAYKDEPGLPLISLMNEGALSWCWTQMKDMPAVKEFFKAWLAKRRTADASFAKDVSDDAEKLTDTRSSVFAQFVADVESHLARKEAAFLRSIGVKALFTAQNCGPNWGPMQLVRENDYDYVDDHFYVDHPHFLRKPWSLPSRCPNVNPVGTRTPPESIAFTRLATKPFCVTEWNFSGPGMYRGVGGIMTGAMAALQDWDGLWRFAYSHGANLLDGQGVPGYFDTASDPLGQASDRASILLFLRGDLAPIRERRCFIVDSRCTEPANGRVHELAPAWRSATWNVQIATSVGPVAGWQVSPLDAKDGEFGSSKPPFVTRSNGAIAMDETRGSLTIDTPRTAGGFAPDGTLSAGPVTFTLHDAAATVWASALDERPIATSRRLLVTHLTDVQAKGCVYASSEKKVLVRSGSGGSLVRRGSADIALALAAPQNYSVWALETSGKRLARVPTRIENGRLLFTANVKGPEGARMLYEVVAE